MVTEVHIRELADTKELQAATALITKVWQAENPPVPFTFMRALSQAGAQVLGGYVEGRLAGVAVGFQGRDAQGSLLHSHAVGVDEPWRGTGVGRAIKFGQRDWCLERGIKRIAWTFDPLRVHNAYFNLGRLGAVGVSYHADFYGPMNDGFNRGIPTDRVLAHWYLTQDGTSPTPCAAPSPDVTLLDIGDDGWPTSNAATFRSGADVRLRVPPTPPADPPTVLRWRLALREAMEPLMHTGYRWTTAAADGTYVLTPPTEDAQH
ncbi:GNAT family N-acetyltransferase [Streptomyces sp. BK340]|uniref:GNAT family N-acetyltransferase n=1 Tax=Streptomyces sp. BK340 TaxID=2572903 RepID=UPI0011A75B27|nr:GNAT family N-acetyltransferase [Streptomyces sp. BK340]TVZ76749.1 putative GNAT superfamily acetyltransferase [Streptomyces sp. BK340]